MNKKDINYTVSVRLMTYMHAPFIKEAMEGIMMQETDFKFEIVIGDDFSTDGTLDIIRTYSDTDNIHIKILKREKGDAYWQKRQELGRLYNFINILENCSGKYVALLDGDDYWTDPLKLQKQVDFLEENEEYAGVASNSYFLFEETKEQKLFNTATENSTLILEELLEHRVFHTASFVFKNQLDYTSNFYSVLSGDRLINILVAGLGKIYYMGEPTCVYRKNNGGISKRVTSSHMIKDLNFIKITKHLLNRKQRLILRIFIYKTILNYSHKIKARHYFYVLLNLLFFSRFNIDSVKVVVRNVKKITL